MLVHMPNVKYEISVQQFSLLFLYIFFMSLFITSILFNLMEGTVYLVHTFGIIDCACQWCMCTRMHGYVCIIVTGYCNEKC